MCAKTEAEVPEGDGHGAPKAQSPRRRSFWLELSGSTVLESRSQKTKLSSLSFVQLYIVCVFNLSVLVFL